MPSPTFTKLLLKHLKEIPSLITQNISSLSSSQKQKLLRQHFHKFLLQNQNALPEFSHSSNSLHPYFRDVQFRSAFAQLFHCSDAREARLYIYALNTWMRTHQRTQYETSDAYAQATERINQYLSAMNGPANENLVDTSLAEQLSPTHMRDLASQIGWRPSQIREYLRKITRSTSTSGLLPDHKKCIDEWLKEHNYRPPSRDEKEHLLHTLRTISQQANSPQIHRAQLTKYLNNHRFPLKRLTSHKKNGIRDWIAEQKRMPDYEELVQLGHENDLSPAQVYVQSRVCLRRIRKLQSNHASQIVKEFMRKKMEAEDGSERPVVLTQEEKEHLMRDTCLDAHQLNSLISYYAHRPGAITRKSKSLVQQWLIANIGASPNRCQRNELLQQTGWSPSQLRSQLRVLKQNVSSTQPLTADVKEHVVQWMKTTGRTRPSLAERQLLAQECGVPEKSVYDFCRRYNDSVHRVGSITPEIRHTVLQWLVDHDFRTPTSEERSRLQEACGVGREQLNGLLRRLSRSRHHSS